VTKASSPAPDLLEFKVIPVRGAGYFFQNTKFAPQYEREFDFRRKFLRGNPIDPQNEPSPFIPPSAPVSSTPELP
jgi:hypothetical protein